METKERKARERPISWYGEYCECTVLTVKAVNGVLVKYAAISVETFTAGDVTPHRMEHHCQTTSNTALYF